MHSIDGIQQWSRIANLAKPFQFTSFKSSYSYRQEGLFTLLSSLCIQRNHWIYLWGNSCLKYSWYTPRVTALSYTFLPPKIKTQIKTIFFDQPLKSSLFKFPGQNKKGNFKNITFIKQVKFTEHIRGRSKMTSCKFTHILTPLPLCHVFMPNALNSWVLIWLTPY